MAEKNNPRSMAGVDDDVRIAKQCRKQVIDGQKHNKLKHRNGIRGRNCTSRSRSWCLSWGSPALGTFRLTVEAVDFVSANFKVLSHCYLV